MRARKAPLITVIVVSVLVLGGCLSPETGKHPTEAQSGATPLQVDEDAVHAQDGSVLLGIADVPSTVRVDRDTEFGATSRFTDAVAAPDGAWTAVATSGAAHSAVWLLRDGSRDPRPAAFQYGGELRIGPWDDTGRYLAVVHMGPAGDRTLSVVDRERLGDTVQDTVLPVRTPGHDQLPPEERIHREIIWKDSRLGFRVADQHWLFDPETGDVRRDD